MKESRNASNLMVVVKLCIILLVIAVGVFYVDTANWDPFAPSAAQTFRPAIIQRAMTTLDHARLDPDVSRPRWGLPERRSYPARAKCSEKELRAGAENAHRRQVP